MNEPEAPVRLYANLEKERMTFTHRHGGRLHREVASALSLDKWLGFMDVEEHLPILCYTCRPSVTWEVTG
jgi:hypothetical protein